jgi:hypothetical protein
LGKAGKWNTLDLSGGGSSWGGGGGKWMGSGISFFFSAGIRV